MVIKATPYEKPVLWLLFLYQFLCISPVLAQRKMERLGRGVVATRTAANRVLVSWRLLGTEPWNTGFNVYRSTGGGSPVRLNSAVLTAGTNFEDFTATLSAANRYQITTVLNGVESDTSAGYTLVANAEAKPFYRIKINKLDNYRVEYVNVGDFDGDGEYDYALHKIPVTDPSGIYPDLVEAYKRDGTYLWNINMGPNSTNRYNITPGSSSLDAGHGDNWTVYDINNDGRAEVILRTANGVKFADSTTLTDANDARQFISVVNGMTGREISRTPVNNPYLSRGQINGHMGIAYLDGIHPSVVWMGANRNADQSFNEFINTWNWNGSTLAHNWLFDLAGKNLPSGHQIKIFDIDGDGRDEIIPQAFAVNDDGTLMYNLKDQAIDHGDRFSISDLDPKRPGLEIYGIQQGYSQLGIMWYYCDAKTGKLLLSQSNPANPDMGRGMTADFDPRYLGQELYTFVGSLYSVTGMPTSTAIPSSYPNQRMYWDADLGGELLDGGKIVKWNYLTNNDTRLYTANSSTGTGANAAVPLTTPSFYGDLIGDWREEAVYESSDREYLIVLESPYLTTDRIYTLPHNPGYRCDMTVKGYYQSNNVDYYLGFDMQTPPVPAIQEATEHWVGNTAAWDHTTSNWSNGQVPKTFSNGDTILFDIRGNSADTIRLNTTAAPARLWAMNPGGKNYTIGGTGKLTGPMEFWKAKEGTFTLGGNHDYTGATVITEGQFNINGSLQSAVQVRGLGSIGGSGILAGGLALDRGINLLGGRISPGFGNTAEKLGTLTVAGNLTVSGDNNFAFDVVPGSTRVNDSLLVTGNLSFSGSNKLIVDFANNQFTPGTYTLIRCNGTLTATPANFVLTGITGVQRELIIQNNSVQVRINATRPPANIVWTGAAGSNWDLDAQNFKLGNAATAFVSGDSTTFDSTATQQTVALNDTVFPAAVTFNGGAAYTLQGAGSIGDTTGITKNGAGNLTILATGNTYTGRTIVNGGTLTVATIGLRNEPSSIGAADSAAANIQLNHANLVIIERSITDRALTITDTTTITTPVAGNYAIFNANITGSGPLIKEGPGSVFLIGAKNFSGPVIIRSGGLNLRTVDGNNNGLGTSKEVTIEDGTLALDDAGDYSTPSWNMTIPAGKNATLVAHGRSNMQGTLSGAGNLNLRIPYIRTSFSGNWSAFTGKLTVNDNEFRVANSFGYANASISLASGLIRSISGTGSTIAIGELSGVAGTTLTSDLGTAIWQIGARSTDAVFAGNITRSALTKVGTGTFTLTGNNTYAGNTAVNEGRLLVNNAAGTRGTGVGNVTVASGATLGGTGFIKGAVTIGTGGKLQPGADGTGTLTDSTAVSFAAGAIAEMDINKTTATFDILKVTGSISFNGRLVIHKIGTDNFVAGNSFRLFDATSYTGAFSSIEPATPGTGLRWDLSELTATGTLKVAIDAGNAITYYWKGSNGTAAAPTSWATAANWNTAADGSGLPRTSPAPNDILIFDGSIMGTGASYAGPVPAEDFGSLLLANAPELTLVSNGNSIHPGNVSISSGRLLVNHTAGTTGIGTGNTTVAGGATLGGTGFVGGAIAVNGGGRLQPGADGIGTFSNGTSISFATGAIAEMEINKAGGTYDVLNTTGSIRYNGQLTIIRLGTANFAAGDSYKLFNATEYSGSFTAFNPAEPGPGLVWDTTQLTRTGTLKVALNPIAKRYYWRGATGSAGSPTSWSVATNWSTVATGTGGSTRTTPLPNDILIFDGATSASERYVGSVPTEMTGAVKFVNGAKITLVSSVYPTTPVSDPFTTALYGGCTYALTGTNNSFASLKPGDVITTATGIVNPMPYAQVLAVADGTHMTVSRESAFPTTAQSQYFLAPTLYTDTLLIDAASVLTMGAGSGSFFSLVLNTKGGTVAGKVNFGSRGGHHKLVCTTPNAGSSTAGLHFTNGAALTIATNTVSKWNYNLGNTLGRYSNGIFVYDNGNGANNVMPGYTGNAGIVFEQGSTFTMGTGEHYTPFGASYAATGELTYTPAVFFQPGSRYVATTAFVNAPQMITNHVHVSYPDLEFQAGFPGNFTVAMVDNLTIGGTTGATTSTGSFLATGDLVNATANAINFGNVMLGGTTNQLIGGTGSGTVAFNTLHIADQAAVSLSKNISATNVHLLGQLHFGSYTISGTGTFYTYAPYSRPATTSLTSGSAVVGGINANGAGTAVYEYPIGSSVTGNTYLPARTLYRSYTGNGNGLLSAYSLGSATGETVLFSIAGASFTTSTGSLTASTPGFAYVLNVNATVLPLQLIAFNGYHSGQTVQLTWHTANESGVNHFVVERQLEGESGFRPIGKVNAVNRAAHTYAFGDTSAVLLRKAYYRLQLVEQDGTVAFSKTILLAGSGARLLTEATLWPNPVATTLVLTHAPVAAGGNITLLSAAGRVVLRATAIAGTVQTRLPVAGLPAGVYLLSYSSNGRTTTFKFIKQ